MAKKQTKEEKVASDLLKEKEDQTPVPEYSDDETKYLGALRLRMESARDARDQQHDEFDGMSFVTQYHLNERLANTFIKPKQNKEDTNFQSGIIRQKLFALLSALVNLNLSGDINAFDKNGLAVQSLGDAMEDTILKTNELDNDNEKKNLRQYELLKQGTVFVEEMWSEMMKTVKTMKGKFSGKLDKEWKTKLKKAFARPTRNVIPGINVYLGDISIYDSSDQPYLFTVDTKPYQQAKMIFGEWDRWKNVPRKLRRYSNEEASVFQKDWTLLQSKEDFVEIVRYQDKDHNEFAVLLNGILMTPVGLPLPWGYEDYNIAQQNLEPIHAKFAYGKSLVARTRNKVALLDEMLRLGVLKTQKSFMPPKFNLTGRIISNRVFMPGKMTHGINPQQILNADDKETQGVTAAEFGMIKEIQESINAETTSPTFAGQQAEGNPTATEIIELQRQAKMILGLTVFAVSMLEWKLEHLRLKNLLANWFNAEDQVVDEMRNVLKDKFRTISVNRTIDGEGKGRRIVIPTKDIPTPEAVKEAEDVLSEEQGVPVRMIFLNPAEVTSSKLIWQITIKPKERRTSETSKLMFRAFMEDAQLFGPLLNMAHLGERFASVWEEDPQKLFLDNPALPLQPEQQGEQAQGGQGSQTLSPRVNLPQPEKALGREIKVGLGVNA